MAIYASFDGQTVLLIDHVTVTETALGDHTVSISAVFLEQAPLVYDLEQDYFLLAKVDSRDAVEEADELNNTYLFDGGIFRDDVHHIVHVHGTDTPNQDPELDKKDVVSLWRRGSPDRYEVQLNDLVLLYADADVSAFHIRTHEGNDDVLTPWVNPSWFNTQSGIEKPMWVFGGAGDDELSGGDSDDKLWGGEGDDVEILGRPGNDVIHGGPGQDIIEGNEGDDTIFGEGGNDRVEGWDGADTIYGDYHHLDELSGSDDGDDIINGGGDNEDPATTDGADTIYGGGGNDRIDGWLGDDQIWGDYHPDDPRHPPDPNTPPAGAGNDEIYGWEGNDTIRGGPGHDDLFGEAGSDTIYGGDFNNGQEIIYPGDKDWIYPPDSETKYPRVDLVADVALPEGIDGSLYSGDNREENGFFGGLDLIVGGPRVRLEINVHSNGVNLIGETLRLGDYDTSLIQLYDSETGGNPIDPNHTWTIDDPEMSLVVWIEALDVGHGSLTLSVDGFEQDRPLLDFLFFYSKLA